MSFQIVVTSVLLVAITLVILRRIFHAHGSRQRTQLLANLSASNNINSGSFKTAWSSQIPGANGTGEGEGKEKGTPPIIAGFLHPYCNAGGGGERVLFAAISYLQRNDPHVLSIVYTGDISPTTKLPVTKAEIIKRCKERFGIELDATKVEFVHLKWRWLIEDAMWKRFTLAGQALGAALLAVEALWKVVPDVFLDTHGLAFSYPISRFLTHGITRQETKPPMPIVAYIHYPTISASMLQRVTSRTSTYANSSTITSSTWRSTAKLIYYRIFTFLYTSALGVIPPTFIAVNSSWTKGHVEALLATRRADNVLPGFIGAILNLGTMLVGWNIPTPKGINQSPKAMGEPQNTPILTGSDTPSSNPPTGVRRIYPPCDVDPLRAFSLEGRKNVVFSCAQFRPEKDHIKQIQSFAILFKAHPELFVSVPEQKDDKTTTTPREDNIITDETITDNAVIGPVSGSGAESAVQEAATREPVTIEQSGWLHVGSSRPSSPSKPSNPLLPSGPAGSTDRNNLVDSANTDKADAGDKGPLKLVLLGSARHQGDLARVEELKGLARKLGIEAHVEFRLNAPYDELLHWLSVSSIGISTMVEEHFGIGVVEFMGAGLIPVVHASGGPIMDIVTPIGRESTGYFAVSAEEFAEQLYMALQMDEKEALGMRTRARESSARFSTVAFESGFRALWEDIKKSL